MFKKIKSKAFNDGFVKGVASAEKVAYLKGYDTANKEIYPMIREIHDRVYEEGIQKGISQAAEVMSDIFDGECDKCPVNEKCWYGKPCIETWKGFLGGVNVNKV